jgi:hypothetical protein
MFNFFYILTWKIANGSIDLLCLHAKLKTSAMLPISLGSFATACMVIMHLSLALLVDHIECQLATIAASCYKSDVEHQLNLIS